MSAPQTPTMLSARRPSLGGCKESHEVIAQFIKALRDNTSQKPFAQTGQFVDLPYQNHNLLNNI